MIPVKKILSLNFFFAKEFDYFNFKGGYVSEFFTEKTFFCSTQNLHLKHILGLKRWFKYVKKLLKQQKTSKMSLPQKNHFIDFLPIIVCEMLKYQFSDLCVPIIF